MPIISIIVPIYNVEQYLIKCIDSILAQTFTDFELILVNDGSPDGCGAICDKYAKKDGRIIVIHKKNGGLSDARNAGIDIAKGEYITFIDSDDYIIINMYKWLYEDIIKENADIAVGGVLKKINGKTSDYMCSGKYYVQNGENAFCTVLWGKEASVTAWGKLYKTSIFKDIRYPKDITSEDVFVIGDVMLKAEKVVFDMRGMYIYLIRDGSITNTSLDRKLEENRYSGYIYNWKLAEKQAPKAVPLVKYRLWWCSRYTLTAFSLAPKKVQKENLDLQKKFSKNLRNDWRGIIMCKYTPLKIKVVSLIGAISPIVYGFIACAFKK